MSFAAGLLTRGVIYFSNRQKFPKRLSSPHFFPGSFSLPRAVTRCFSPRGFFPRSLPRGESAARGALWRQRGDVGRAAEAGDGRLRPAARRGSAGAGAGVAQGPPAAEERAAVGSEGRAWGGGGGEFQTGGKGALDPLRRKCPLW